MTLPTDFTLLLFGVHASYKIFEITENKKRRKGRIVQESPTVLFVGFV